MYISMNEMKGMYSGLLRHAQIFVVVCATNGPSNDIYY